MSQSLQQRYASSPLFGANAPYVEDLYEAFLDDPESVPENWRQMFTQLRPGNGEQASHRALQAALAAGHVPAAAAVAAGPRVAAANEKQAAVSRLIQVYSLRGHQIADLDPLGMMDRRSAGVLKPGLPGSDRGRHGHEFFTGGLAGTGHGRLPLREIVSILRKVYCGKVGADFAHLSRGRERLWIREHLERGMLTAVFDNDDRHMILDQLTAAEGIERYLHTKYVGQKRFSLEGGDSLIPMLRRPDSAGGVQRRAGDRDWHGPPRADQCAGERPG